MNTPGPAPPTVTGPTAPTLGAVIGSVIGSAVVAATGLSTEPVMAASVVSAITGLFTTAFHWVGSKIGQSSW